ncbi:MAG TPA: GNAT family N-acetyltransferase [Chthoniobacterales bacterium]|jgi:phosphinothricin acetyltransferase|nr:GNAT family N-acetyltransferase [Chthoniobacterales bacterium]
MTHALRTATPADAGAITDLLNHYVSKTTSTFITEPQTVEQQIAWFTQRSERYPAVAVETGGRLIGWGALSPHNPRGGYRYSADISIYLHPDFHRQGIGRALLRELIERARSLGHHVLVAGCCTESTASIALHESLGFERVGTFRQIGRKFDRWLDVVYLQLILGKEEP